MSPASLAVLSVFVAGAVGAFVFVAGHAADCTARWADSGFQWRYDQSAGCQVKAGNRWVPERAVRVHVREPG